MQEGMAAFKKVNSQKQHQKERKTNKQKINGTRTKST